MLVLLILSVSCNQKAAEVKIIDLTVPEQIVFDPNWIQDQELSTVVQSVGAVYKVTENIRVDAFSILKTE
jgi:hypothetical protein